MNRTRLSYAAGLTGYFGLLGLLTAWVTWLSPPTVLPISLVLLVGVGPLLFPLRGLLHGRPYTFAWTSFLALLYFTHGIVEVYSSPSDRLLAVAEIGFSGLLYVGSTLYARFRSREQKQAAAETTSSE